MSGVSASRGDHGVAVIVVQRRDQRIEAPHLHRAGDFDLLADQARQIDIEAGRRAVGPGIVERRVVGLGQKADDADARQVRPLRPPARIPEAGHRHRIGRRGVAPAVPCGAGRLIGNGDAAAWPAARGAGCCATAGASVATVSSAASAHVRKCKIHKDCAPQIAADHTTAIAAGQPYSGRGCQAAQASVRCFSISCTGILTGPCRSRRARRPRARANRPAATCRARAASATTMIDLVLPAATAASSCWASLVEECLLGLVVPVGLRHRAAAIARPN